MGVDYFRQILKVDRGDVDDLTDFLRDTWDYTVDIKALIIVDNSREREDCQKDNRYCFRPSYPMKYPCIRHRKTEIPALLIRQKDAEKVNWTGRENIEFGLVKTYEDRGKAFPKVCLCSKSA